MTTAIDLSLEFLGLHFRNPFVLPSAQAVRTREMILRAFEAGWAGAVTQTLFWDVDRIKNVRPRLHAYHAAGEIVGLVNIELVTMRPFDEWLEDIHHLKQAFPDRPLIASLMGEGHRPDEWVQMALACEQAGVDALELNLSCPHGMPEIGSGAFIGQNSELTEHVTRWVVEASNLPVLVKLTPDVTNIVAIARSAVTGGASGVTAINNLRALAGVDIYQWAPLPSVDGFTSFGGYAGPGLKPVALRCVAEIAQGIPGTPIAATGGIESWEDAVEYLLVGAGLIQIYTAIMKRGYRIIDELTTGLHGYLELRGESRISSLVGGVLSRIIPHQQLNRSRVIAEYDPALCIRCNLCHTACNDSGFQAVAIGHDGFPSIDPEACDGCGLCVTLCPVEKCMWSKVM